MVLRVLGKGGTGTVYASYDEKLDRKVAVKLVAANSSDAQTHQARVLREAQAMARISHPNVVQVFEVGELGSQVFIAMEFIDGVTLTDWQRTPGRTWKEILQLYRAAGQGLWAAHQAGLVHRDFKAESISSVEKLRNFVRVEWSSFALMRGSLAKARDSPSTNRDHEVRARRGF